MNPLHGSLMRSCTVAAGIHIYAFPFSFVHYLLTLQIFNILFCIEIFSNCSNPAHRYSSVRSHQSVPAPGIVYCHRGTLQQNLDSIKIIDFRNGFSLAGINLCTPQRIHKEYEYSRGGEGRSGGGQGSK